jgi:uncharacterized protein YtpQ (UPF0354 family)
MKMPWWGWIILAVVAFALLVIVVGTRYHNKVRREFVDYLAQTYAEFQVTDANNDRLTLKRGDGGEGVLYLDKLFKALNAVANTPEQRRAVYEHFAASLLADVQEYDRKLDPQTDRARVMPRLVTADFLANLPSEAELPTRPLGDTGLSVAYVLDSAQRVNYITAAHVRELDIDSDDALHALALANLRKISSTTMVRDAIEGQLVVIKSMDTYDAVRVLLVPETLREGESVLAAVPDRDTLAMISVPRSEARGFPMTADNTDHLLLNKPLWVTRDQIELA